MKVLIIDDDALVTQSLSTILSVEADVEVVGLGHSDPEVIEKYQELEPDTLLMDIQMPGGDGLNAAERILAGSVVTHIVFLAAFSDDEYTMQALKMGSHDYLVEQDVAQVAPALRPVMAGVCALEGEVLERSAIMRLSVRPEPGGPQSKPLRGIVFMALIDCEYEVVGTVAEGLDSTEVAARLFMSEGTVRSHISLTLAKLGLRNRTQVAVMYYHSVQTGQRSAHKEADTAIVAGTVKRYRGVTGPRSDLELHVSKTALPSECGKDSKRVRKRGPNA